MNALNISIADINSIIRNTARDLLIYQTYYQEIIYKCKQSEQMNQLKTDFARENQFLNQLFTS
jgi:hypothetical protein